MKYRVCRAIGSSFLGPILLLVAAGSLGCGDPGTGPPEEDEDGDRGLASVTVTPGEATLESRGETVDLEVSGRTRSGFEIEDYFVTWSPTDPAVATVDRVGVVTARDTGETRIVAALREDGLSTRILVADTARVTVTGLVAVTVLRPAGTSLESVGDTARFRAEPLDAVGEEVKGVTFRFTSSDTAVVALGPADSGAVVVTAVDTGVAEVVATPSTGPDGRAPVEVARPAPRLAEIVPDTLTEGEPATVRGRNLKSVVADPVVRVAGKEAEVIAVVDTTIRFRVPRFGCRPLRMAGVRVIVVDDSADAGVSVLRPDEPTLNLAPGERRVVRGREFGYCLQFGESSAPEEYLVGIQSLSTIPGITRVALRVDDETRGAEGGRAGGRADPAAPPETEERRTGSILSRPERPLRDHYRREAGLRGWEIEYLAPRINESLPRRGSVAARPPIAYSHGPGGESSVPGSVSLGDTIELRVPGVGTDEICANYENVRGVVREIGTHGIWIEDTANPDAGYTGEDWTEMSDRFDDLVYPTDVEYFGTPTDVDENGRIVLVVTRAVNEAGYLGFVFAGDLFPRTADSDADCDSSDEGELAYLVAPDPDGVHGPERRVEELKEDNPRLVAHELAHVIQFGTRMECDECSWMPSFVSEGQAVVAEEVTGHAASGRSTGNDYGGAVVWEEPAGKWYKNRFVDLARYFGWGGSGVRVEGAPEECSWLARDWAGPCEASRGVYGVPSSIMRWMADHFGPDHPGGEAGLFRDMTANTEVGYANWEELTGLTIGDILAYWAPALWADGRVEVADPMLSLPSWDVADIFGAVVPEAKLRPHRRRFAEMEEELGVNAGSAAYYLIGSDSRPHTAIVARSADGSALPAHMQIWVMRTR